MTRARERASGAGGRSDGRRALAAALLLAAAFPGLPSRAAGQAPPTGGDSAAGRPPRDPAGHPFRTPAASPLEPVHRLGILHVSRDTAEGAVAVADLGDRLAFWILRRPAGPLELAGALAAGAFSRFDLESADNEFVEVHYRAGFQLRARYREVAARAELFHASSHLGDEYLERTGREPVSTSREGVEILVQIAPSPGLTLYGGPGTLLRSTEDLEAASARLGVEWRSAPADGSGAYVSADAFAWSELDWEPILAFEGGVAFGPRARLGATFGSGPSRAEQFFRESENVVGLVFSFRR
ncbi:MAG: DUF1207 domain-containing protein [Gemmatimonadota bacterium]